MALLASHVPGISSSLKILQEFNSMLSTANEFLSGVLFAGLKCTKWKIE